LRKLTQWNIVKVIKEELLSHSFTGAESSSVLGRGGALISPLQGELRDLNISMGRKRTCYHEAKKGYPR
jgi:hypothetical protein